MLKCRRPPVEEEPLAYLASLLDVTQEGNSLCESGGAAHLVTPRTAGQDGEDPVPQVGVHAVQPVPATLSARYGAGVPTPPDIVQRLSSLAASPTSAVRRRSARWAFSLSSSRRASRAVLRRRARSVFCPPEPAAPAARRAPSERSRGAPSVPGWCSQPPAPAAWYAPPALSSRPARPRCSSASGGLRCSDTTQHKKHLSLSHAAEPRPGIGKQMETAVSVREGPGSPDCIQEARALPSQQDTTPWRHAGLDSTAAGYECVR